MQAIAQDVYGSARTLRFGDIEMPVIGDDEPIRRHDTASTARLLDTRRTEVPAWAGRGSSHGPGGL